MGNKIRGALKKSGQVFIVIALLWIVLSIIFVVPLSVTIADTSEGTDFFTSLLTNFSTISTNLGKIFAPKYFATFWKGELYLSIVLIFFAGVGMAKSMPKNEYTDIEHGSSDWAEHRRAI